MIRAQIHRICDRCNKAYSLLQFDVSDGLPAVERRPPVEIRQGEEVLARFEDLCEDCDRVVDKLLSRIVLEKETKKKPGGDNTQGPDTTTDQSQRTLSDDSGAEDPESEGGDHNKEGGAAEDAAPEDLEASPTDGAESALEETSESDREHPF